MLKELNRQVFTERFRSDRDYYEFPTDLKWNDGYTCKKCDSADYLKGKQPCSRSCSNCGYDESTISGTLFHKLEFEFLKAFEILYEITTSKKGAYSICLAERFGLNQKKDGLFARKYK